jgi:hypothetical protein
MREKNLYHGLLRIEKNGKIYYQQIHIIKLDSNDEV